MYYLNLDQSHWYRLITDIPCQNSTWYIEWRRDWPDWDSPRVSVESTEKHWLHHNVTFHLEEQCQKHYRVHDLRQVYQEEKIWKRCANISRHKCNNSITSIFVNFHIIVKVILMTWVILKDNFKKDWQDYLWQNQHTEHFDFSGFSPFGFHCLAAYVLTLYIYFLHHVFILQVTTTCP